MRNCPCVPYGKKCIFEKKSNDLLGCCASILSYRFTELKMEIPIIGKYIEPYVCNLFIEESEVQGE